MVQKALVPICKRSATASVGKLISARRIVRKNNLPVFGYRLRNDVAWQVLSL